MPRSAVLVVAAILVATSAAAEAWDEPFAADPQALLAATATLPSEPGDGVALLLEEGSHRLTDDGHERRTHRWIYRILDADGMRGWGSLEGWYEPWLSGPPELRARVISPSGAVSEIDPKTIDDAPGGDDQDVVLSSSRVRRAPLPGLVPGAVVETMVTWTDEAPMMPGVVSGAWGFGFGLPIATCRVTLDTPASLPATTVLHGLDLAPHRREADGRIVTTWSLSSVPRRERPLSLLPGDVPAFVALHWTTARSWAQLATAYAAIVNDKASTSAVAEMARRAAGDAKEPLAVADRCLVEIQRRARYTGVEFGKAAIVPASPSECLARGFGDCKDKATLLVAMLRSLGLKADVALLDVGPGEDVEPAVPQLALFNHAIVAMGDPPTFIDATAEHAAAGELPDGDRGRWALVARDGVTGLARIPRSSAGGDRTVEAVTIELAESGKARVTEVDTHAGSFAMSHRASTESTPEKDLQQGLDGWVRDEWMAEKASAIERSAATDRSSPTRLAFAVDGSRRTQTEYPMAFAALPHGGWRQQLSDVSLGEEPEHPSDDERKARERETTRTAPAELTQSFSWVRSYRIVPPPGYARLDLPPAESWTVGPVSYAFTIEAADDGVVTAAYTFDTGDGRLTAAQLQQLRAKLQAIDDAKLPLVAFRSIAEQDLEDGDVRGGLAELRRLEALHPKEALHHGHLADALGRVGLGDAAQKEARAAVAIEPDSALAHRALAGALGRDALGRSVYSEAALREAEDEVTKAVTLAPDDAEAASLLGRILTTRPGGGVEQDPKRSRRAAEAWKRAGELAEDDPDLRMYECAAWLRALEPATAWTRATEWKGERSLNLDAIAFAALVENEGVDKARARATAPPFRDRSRGDLYPTAAGLLFTARRYADAAALLTDAAKGSTDADSLGARADACRALAALPRLPPETEPAGAALGLLAASTRGDVAGVRRLLSPSVLTDEQRDEQARMMVAASQKALARIEDVTLENTLDALALARCTTDLDGVGGAQVVVHVFGSSAEVVMFFRREGDAWRLLDAEASARLGKVAFELASSGQAPAARKWLDWVAERAPADVELKASFLEEWPKGAEHPAGSEKLAAALLAAVMEKNADGPATTFLNAERPAASDDVRRRIDVALLLAGVRRDDVAGTLSVAKTLVGDERTRRLACDAVAGLGAPPERPETLAFLEAERARHPDDAHLVELIAPMRASGGAIADAVALLRSIPGAADAMRSNNIAWFALLAGEPPESLVQMARDGASGGNPAAVHTLACVLAECGRALEARQVLLRSIGAEEPSRSDWHVIGRVAESYGELDAARDAYRKVLAGEGAKDPGDVATLSRKRLALLDAASGG